MWLSYRGQYNREILSSLVELIVSNIYNFCSYRMPRFMFGNWCGQNPAFLLNYWRVEMVKLSFIVGGTWFVTTLLLGQHVAKFYVWAIVWAWVFAVWFWSRSLVRWKVMDWEGGNLMPDYTMKGFLSSYPTEVFSVGVWSHLKCMFWENVGIVETKQYDVVDFFWFQQQTCFMERSRWNIDTGVWPHESDQRSTPPGHMWSYHDLATRPNSCTLMIYPSLFFAAIMASTAAAFVPAPQQSVSKYWRFYRRLFLR